MKRSLQAVAVAMSMMLLVACSSSEYIISTNDGTMITAMGKPKLDEKSGMYTYKDSKGKRGTLKKEDVKQIMER